MKNVKKIGDLKLRVKLNKVKRNVGLINAVGKLYKTGFDKGFPKKGYMTDNSLTGWKPRKRYYKHPILQKTKALRRSNKFIRLSNRHGYIIFDIEYASYVNDERDFAGDSTQLERDGKNAIYKYLNKIFR
jgi:hypothetical protein